MRCPASRVPVLRRSVSGSVGPDAPLVPREEVGIDEHFQVARDGRLREPDGVLVRSQTQLPGNQVNPAAVVVMAEVRIDVSDQTPKLLTLDTVPASDVVIKWGGLMPKSRSYI